MLTGDSLNELTVTEPTKPIPTEQSIARTQRETTITITKEELDRLWNALEYTRATISPSGNFKSKENPGWVEIHGGRAHQSESFLIQAIDFIEEKLRELK